MRLFCVSKDERIRKMVADSAAKGLWSVEFGEDYKSLPSIEGTYFPNILLIELEANIDVDWWKSRNSGKWLLYFLSDDQAINESLLAASFEAGADGILPKKCLGSSVLENCLCSSFARWQGRRPVRFYQTFNLHLDRERHLARVQEKILNLTQSEFQILEQLAGVKDSSGVTRDLLSAQLFGDPSLHRRSLDVHVCSLRKKLRSFALGIEAVRGRGYRLSPCPR